jgi:hypothetical protein
VTSATFAKWVLSGILPSTVSITGKYDMRALDAALDKLSGIKSIEQSEDSFESSDISRLIWCSHAPSTRNHWSAKRALRRFWWTSDLLQAKGLALAL